MIFVITGTEIFPFDRLPRQIDHLAEEQSITEPVFVQLGSCNYEPRFCRWERFIPFSKVCQYIEDASIVVTHAGAGSTLLCISMGKFPILVPRRKHLGEHTDDHQLTFAGKMDELGYGRILMNIDHLQTALQQPPKIKTTSPEAKGKDALIAYLKNIIHLSP